jgi:uncharacterized protein (AIM24 family)
VSFNAQTLPANGNINPYAFCIDVTGEMLIRKGKMIAYYGSLRFEALGAGPFEVLVNEVLNSPLLARNFVVVTGRGKLILGDRGRNLAYYDLEDGSLVVRSENVLGFQPTLVCRESIIPGYLTLLGTGSFVASSNGPVHFFEPPVKVDEDALLGWADMPAPSYRYDYNYVRGALRTVGALVKGWGTGEEKQLDFSGSGTVLIQASERGVQR